MIIFLVLIGLLIEVMCFIAVGVLLLIDDKDAEKWSKDDRGSG